MSNFYAQICSNGHVLINRHPSDDNEYCEICGAKMLSKCPNCNSTIREWHYNGVTVLGSVKYERPNYCKSCGKAYPWTEAALQSTALLIQEEELSEQLKVSLVESLPDIITETPKTNLAVVRVKNVLQVPVNLLLMQSVNLLSILVVNLPKNHLDFNILYSPYPGQLSSPQEKLSFFNSQHLQVDFNFVLHIPQKLASSFCTFPHFGHFIFSSPIPPLYPVRMNQQVLQELHKS